MIMKKFQLLESLDSLETRLISVSTILSNDFAEQFRICRAVMEDVLNNGGPMLQAGSNRDFPLSPKEQLLLCICYIVSGSLVQIIGDNGRHKAIVSRKVHKVVNWLIDHYFDNVITWPNNMVSIASIFYRKARMSCVIGCLDGIHILIKAPAKNEPQFVNRKGDHSINCTMVCGPNYKFYYVSV